MTVRQQIEELISAGLRNCEIERQLKCDPAYIWKVRKASGMQNETARVKRMPEVASMFAIGLTDNQISERIGKSSRTVRVIRGMCNLRRTETTGRPSKLDRIGIAAAYSAGEKIAYISAVFRCHESTPTRIAAAMGIPKRKTSSAVDIKSIVSENMEKPAKLLAAELNTTAGYINKLKCRIRNAQPT